MTRPRADVAAQSTADTRVRRLGARSSLSHSRWGQWLGSLIVAGGAVLLVTVAGSGGTAAQVPSAIQVGGQARTVTSIVSKPKVSTPSTQPVAPSTSPTTNAVSHRTTVIKPVSTVTDRKDSGRDGPSGVGGNSGDSYSGTTTSTTTTTTTPTTTSTSVVG